MEKVIDLKDLLKHEIMDLYSAEEQIIEALPAMIEKAGNAKLKSALEDHLKITEHQKSRLDEVKQLLAESNGEEGDGDNNAQQNENRGFFSRLFGGGEQKCKGMEGLIAEGKKMMGEDMSPEATDAAIIASAQKIEHYEICGYGTARAFARELNLVEVANKLEQTLNEEYAADDSLTALAVGKVNVVAEFATAENGTTKKSGNSKKQVAKKALAKKVVKAADKKSAPLKKSNSKTKAPAKSAAKKTSPAKKTSSKASSSKAPVKSAAAKKTSAKSGKNKSAKASLFRRR